MARFSDWVRSVLPAERRRRIRELLVRASKSYVIIVIVGVLIGLQVAPAASNLTADPTSGTVAVIPIEGSITGGSAGEIGAMLERARQDPEIKAVVLRVNTPGGSAPASETLYMEVSRTAEQMPVIASVGAMSASGGYYAMAPADQIYTKPAALVGSVGVFFIAPSPLNPIDQIITTGPNKISGADEREWEYKVESLRRAFTGAVVESRGDRLEISEEQLSHAKLYTGGEAVQNGMVDEIGGSAAAVRRAAEEAGSLRDATERAASEAGLGTYDVKVMHRDGTVYFLARANFLAASAENKEMVEPTFFTGEGQIRGPNALMLPPEVVLQPRTTAERPHNESDTARPVTAVNESDRPTTTEGAIP